MTPSSRSTQHQYPSPSYARRRSVYRTRRTPILIGHQPENSTINKRTTSDNKDEYSLYKQSVFLKKQSSDDGEEGKQNSEGSPSAQARHAPLKEEASSVSAQVDYMSLFAKLAANTPSKSQADPSSEDEEDFSFPKRTARHTARTTPSPIYLRNSFAALTDVEEEQETTPILLQPTFKDRLPPIFIKTNHYQENLNKIKAEIDPDTRIQIQGPYLKIVTRNQTEYS